MKRKRYTTEQIIAILRQPDTGKTVQEACRGNNLSEQTFYRWRKKYGNLELADVKRFKELEKENTELKKMLVAEGLCLSQPQLVNLQLPTQAGQEESSAVGRADFDLVLATSPLRLPAHSCLAGEGRLGGKQEICTGSATFFGLTG